MTPKFEYHDEPRHPSLGGSKSGNSQNQQMGALDTMKRDRFELLSAYLDGEVTAQESRQVRQLLETDPQVQRLYARLLKLRQGLQTSPVPAREESAQKIVEKFFRRLNRQRQQTLAWGGTAIAAVFMAALSGVIPGEQNITPQLSQSPEPKIGSERLMIALNGPVVEIPKAPVAPPDRSLVSRALIVE